MNINICGTTTTIVDTKEVMNILPDNCKCCISRHGCYGSWANPNCADFSLSVKENIRQSRIIIDKKEGI